MPEKASDFGVVKCTSCASLNGQGLGPLPTVSHEQVCCLFKLTRRPDGGFLDKAASHKWCEYERLGDSFLSRGKFQEGFQVGPVYRPPLSSSNYGLQEEFPTCKPVIISDGMHKTSDSASAVTQSTFLEPEDSIGYALTFCKVICEVAEPLSSRKRKKRVEPRLRQGFSNYTLEWRPPRFKQKLWFGTYFKDEIDRATDGANYYLGHGEPFLLPDSARIFAERPLKGIKLEDVSPSCDQKIDGKLAHKYFAKKVTEIIYSVLGKRKEKKKSYYSSQNVACRKSHNLQSLLNKAPKGLDIYDPIVPPAPGSTTLANTQFESCRPSPEASYLLAASHPMFLPPDIISSDEEVQRYYTQMQSEELQSSRWSFPLDQMFATSPPISISDYAESSSSMEWNNQSIDLWDPFQNEDPSFPSK